MHGTHNRQKNVVFSFLFLVVTAALGPYMILNYQPGVGEARGKKQEAVGHLQIPKMIISRETSKPYQ